MILGYDWQVKKRENLRTGFLLFKKIGVSLLGRCFLLINFNMTVGKVCDNEYYLSNIAIYPKYREMGVGKRLVLEVEKEAKTIYAKRMVLDVETENISALNFYKKLGYRAIKDFSISLQKNKELHLNRMVKEVR